VVVVVVVVVGVVVDGYLRNKDDMRCLRDTEKVGLHFQQACRRQLHLLFHDSPTSAITGRSLH